MSATNPQLVTIALGDPPDAWRSAGFDVDRSGRSLLGSTTLVLTGSGAGVDGWALAGVEVAIDGLSWCEPVTGGPAEHPNGITRIDHVVVRTGDCERTIAAFTEAGFELRGGRSTTSYGAPMRQSFFWAGDVIVELIGPDEGEPRTDEPTTFFGLALVAADIDTTARHLGALLSGPKDAVQPGRRIAGLRGREVGITVPVAVMSPHVGDGT